MDKVPFQILFLGLCIGAGWWINRKSFTGFTRYVNGIPVPSYAIATVLSIFMGLIFWGILNLLLLKFG